MAIDFEALKQAVDDAQREASEATAADEALAAAVTAQAKEKAERDAALQRIVDIVQQGM